MLGAHLALHFESWIEVSQLPRLLKLYAFALGAHVLTPLVFRRFEVASR